MTSEIINAAKNVLGGVGSTKNILQNINLSSKVVQSISKELNKWQSTTVINNDNDNNNSNSNLNDNRNQNNNNYKNRNDNRISNNDNNKDNIFDNTLKFNKSTKEEQSKGPGLALSYCIAFSPDLKKCLCNVHDNHITVRTARIITMSEYLQDKMMSYEQSMKAMANKLLSRDKYRKKRRILLEGNKDKNKNKEKGKDKDKDRDKDRDKDKDSDEHKDKDEDKDTSHCARYAAVTLITVGWAHDYDDGTMDPILESWCGPKVTNAAIFYHNSLHSLLFHFILFYFVLFYSI